MTQAQRLARMKLLAVGLLAAAAVLYAVASALEPRHIAWGFVAAFAEAAMIGAMADWFAVVALFRHPLGLPIPHTAIIPNNKARIGSNLANFICNNFLGTPQVLDKLRSFDPAAHLATWLAQPANAAKAGAHLVSAARYALSAFDDERVRDFIRRTAIARLQQIDVTQLAGQLLDVLTADRRHQALLDEVLHEVGRQLEDEDFQHKIAEMIAAEMDYLRWVRLDKVAGKLATAKIVASSGRLIAEMSDDPQHPLRLRFDDYMARFIERLKADESLRVKGENIRDSVLAHPALAAYLHGLWSDLLAWLHTDLGRPDSGIGARLTQAAQTLGGKLLADSAMQQWFNDQIVAAAPPLIDRYREDIRRYIVARVAAWNTDELTLELELNIGRDLQFVRINGTLVGGLIGVLIHGATLWVRSA
ncbi:MAG TPA: DUF445 domain-containing protein [Rhizobacter sp.]|nr:DUF445 domain-containing protein [Rhizobacter sp.]